MDSLDAIVWVLFILLLSLLVFTVIDKAYIEPQATEKANEICRERGFDHQVDFTRKGLWSTKPLAIECGYVKEYRLVDLNTRGIKE